MPLNSNALAGDGSVYGADVAGPVDGLYRAIKWDPMYSHLVRLGLTTNLKLCLDDGVTSALFPSIASFPPVDQTGSTETWVARQLYKVASQPSWADSIHKASAKFTLMAWFYCGNTTAGQGLIGDNGNAAATGFQWLVKATRIVQLYVGNGASVVNSTNADTAINNNAWNFIAVSLDATVGAGGGFHYLNGSYNQVSAANTFDSTYSSPSAGGAAQTVEVTGNGNDAVPLLSGSRQPVTVAIQGTALSKANVDSVFAATRGRFGI